MIWFSQTIWNIDFSNFKCSLECGFAKVEMNIEVMVDLRLQFTEAHISTGLSCWERVPFKPIYSLFDALSNSGFCCLLVAKKQLVLMQLQCLVIKTLGKEERWWLSSSSISGSAALDTRAESPLDQVVSATRIAATPGGNWEGTYLLYFFFAFTSNLFILGGDLSTLLFLCIYINSLLLYFSN